MRGLMCIKYNSGGGCHVATKVVSDIEAKVGGKYCHAMTIHGTEYPSDGRLLEFDPPALLAYETSGPPDNTVFHVRVEFTERGSQTEVRLTHSNIPTDISPFIQDGWKAGFGKLETLLRTYRPVTKTPGR